MNGYLYYNTLYCCETDGKDVFINGRKLKPFVPKDRAKVYYRINRKQLSFEQIKNIRYLVKIKPKTDNLPDWAK
jgi:hypothetical protein